MIAVSSRARATLERASERVMWGLVSLGLTPSSWPGSACGTVILEVNGRRSGRLQSTLVTWVEHDGARYLVSMARAEPQWVRNMRAAGGTVALRHGARRDQVRLLELPAGERSAVLQAWYRFTGLSAVPRRHFGLNRKAAIEDFERLAAAHPVFRIISAAGVASEPAGDGARRLTRDVEPSAMRRLLDDPPRATVAFVERDAVQLLPARARCRAERHLFGVLTDAAPGLESREVVLVIDDGAYWFELRGVSVRGLAARVGPAEPEGAGRLAWYAIEPRRVLAWDYGSIREA